MGFSTEKKANEKKKIKLDPRQFRTPRCSPTGPEESNLPADSFYFVAIICHPRETDFQKSMTTDSSSSSGGGGGSST